MRCLHIFMDLFFISELLEENRQKKTNILFLRYYNSKDDEGWFCIYSNLTELMKSNKL